MNSVYRTVAAWLGIGLAVILTHSLDDALIARTLPAVRLPDVVVVHAAPGQIEQAMTAARAAGADEVVAAAELEQRLGVDDDGVVRRLHGALLPLPEALDAWLVVDAASLTESQLLAGRTAIVGAHPAPTRYRVPGRTEPVSSTTLTAAAWGAREGGHTLLDGTGVSVLLALVLGVVGLPRTRDLRSQVPVLAGGSLALLGLGLSLRYAGVAVPIVGLALVPWILGVAHDLAYRVVPVHAPAHAPAPRARRRAARG